MRMPSRHHQCFVVTQSHYSRGLLSNAATIAHLDGVHLALLQVGLHFLKLAANHRDELTQEAINMRPEVEYGMAVLFLKAVDGCRQAVKSFLLALQLLNGLEELSCCSLCQRLSKARAQQARMRAAGAASQGESTCRVPAVAGMLC